MSGSVIGAAGPGYDFSSNFSVTTNGLSYGGALYAFLNQGGHYVSYTGDNLVHALFSTDGGLNWSEFDAGNGPPVGSSTSVVGYCICQDGTTVYVLTVSGTSSVSVVVNKFDLILNQWTNGISTTAGLLGFSPATPLLEMSLTLRGAGDMVFMHSGAQVGGFGRAYYATFDGSSFGASLIIPGQSGSFSYFPNAAVCDSAAITHFFYSKGGDALYHVTMSHAGTFSVAVETVSTTGVIGVFGGWSAPILFSASGTEYVGIVGLTDAGGINQENRFFWAQSTLNISVPMTWHTAKVSGGEYGDRSVSTIAWHDNFDFPGPTFSLSFQGGTLAVFYTQSDFSDVGFIYAYKSAFPPNDTSWTGPTEVITLTFPSAHTIDVCSWPITGGIAVIGCGAGGTLVSTEGEQAMFNIFSTGSPSGPANRYRPIW